MQTEGLIIGLCGPSGIGKGYLKDHIRAIVPDVSELTVATTRTRRASDGVDRDTDIPVGLFLQRRNAGEIIFAHQPFGVEGDWYGFYDEQVRELLSQGRRILTEIHVDNVQPFKEKHGQRVIIVGLVAERDYLEENLRSRATESLQEQQRRLDAALREAAQIQTLYKEGFVDVLMEVNHQTRGELLATAQSHIESAISFFGKERYE